MNQQQLETYKWRHRLHSALLLTVLAGLMAYLANLVGGTVLAWMAAGAVLLLYLFNPVGSSRIVLSMNRARPLNRVEAPDLFYIRDRLIERAGLRHAPQLYIVPSPQLNAFATGQGRDSAIALSSGLLQLMDRREIGAVLAHEMSHIVNGDLRTMAFAGLVGHVTRVLSLVGQLLLIFSLPWWLASGMAPPLLPILLLLAAPVLTALIQLALSRNHEFEADRSAVELSGDPAGLASALIKLEQHNQPFWEQWLFHRRQPTTQNRWGLQWLRTHPTTEERIARLRAMSQPEVSLW